MEVWLYMWRTMRYAEIPIFFHIGNFHVCQFGKNASWGIFVGCLRLLNYRQRCKFIHEAAISFISGSLSMNQQSHSLFTRSRHLGILPFFAISRPYPSAAILVLFTLEAFVATLHNVIQGVLKNMFN